MRAPDLVIFEPQACFTFEGRLFANLVFINHVLVYLQSGGPAARIYRQLVCGFLGYSCSQEKDNT